MQEDFLHYVWQHKAFSITSLKTTRGERVDIKKIGQHNQNSGPDFFNALISVGNQLWAGNVEIHIKSSDWYVHNHENDKAYDNVILHVVWEHDTEIFRKDNSVIPTLELKHFVDIRLLQDYEKLIKSKSWINCETDFPEVNSFVLNNWLERLFVERLELKSQVISKLLEDYYNDWEAVLFKMLLKNFGLKVNGESFFSLANSVDYSIIRKLQNNVLEIEALLFGQAGLLQEDIEDSYYLDLKRSYHFLQRKFRLDNRGVLPVQFFRLRPSNFPTIRLSQFANLYGAEHQLFSKIISASTAEDFYRLFKKEVSDFWTTHYTFAKTSKTSKKQLTKPLIDLIIINTIIPVKFAYAKANAQNIINELFNLIGQLKAENNSVVRKFLDLKPMENSAMSSQALLQLKQDYCDKNKCLQCAIGNSLILKN